VPSRVLKDETTFEKQDWNQLNGHDRAVDHHVLHLSTTGDIAISVVGTTCLLYTHRWPLVMRKGQVRPFVQAFLSCVHETHVLCS
jgi:hypothetical protein